MKHTKTSCKIISVLLSAAMLLPLCACGSDKVEENIAALGADVSVTVYGKGAAKGASDAAGVFKALNSMLDSNSESSAIYALNHANGQSVVVPGQIVDMLNAAKTVYAQTDGALDPTVEPVLALWGFDSGKFTKPTDNDIDLAKGKLCFNDVKVENFAESGTYTVTLPTGAELSFNAIARGCAGDYAVEAMKNDGVTAGIVSMAGCVQTCGAKPDGSPWNVAIQDPDNANGSIGYLSVGETAVSTSGGYSNCYTYSDGVTYHHIINPATGYPAKTDLKSVTVVSDNGTMADCLSTALFILGKNAALKYWRDYGDFEMLLVTEDNQVVCTSGLVEAFTLQNNSYKLSYTE